MTAAAMSSASHAPTTLTPPSSSHGNESSWPYSTDRLENPYREKQSSIHTSSSRAPLVSQNGNSYPASNHNSLDGSIRKTATGDQSGKPRAEDAVNISSYSDAAKNDEATAVNGTRSIHYGKTVSSNGPVSDFYAEDPDDPNSHWIHRDKLAKIENEELQAAGFILPKARAPSKARHRDRSVENGGRSRKNSKPVVEVKMPDISVPSWDLRLPEEVASSDYFVSVGAKGGSRIPVAKTSPLPLRDQHLERDAPVHKKRDGSPESNSIKYPKPRSRSASASLKAETTPPKSAGLSPGKRSATDGGSPKKTAALRKPSAKGAQPGRPKTRSGPSKDSTGSNGQRPSTRSGEHSGGTGQKPMEGDPPWMVSAYTPDPRLPPEQQLLPTVAKRLQQEKWEREGKFGTVYDREFRPLTEEGFLKPPEASGNASDGDPEKSDHEWPLKEAEGNKTPTSPSKAGAYSTMPKIQDKPQMSPLPSPRSPLNQTQAPAGSQTIVRVPEEPKEEPEKKGCGCCIVM